MRGKLIMATIKIIPSKKYLLVDLYEQILMVNNGIIVRAYEKMTNTLLR